MSLDHRIYGVGADPGGGGGTRPPNNLVEDNIGIVLA